MTKDVLATSALFVFAKAGVVLSGFLAGRWLGPELYGTANVAMAVAAFWVIAFTLGFPLAISTFVAKEADEKKRRPLITAALAAFAVWAAVLLVAQAWLRAPLSTVFGIEHAVLAWAAAYALFNAMHNVTASPLLGLLRFPVRARAEALYGVCTPLALAALWLLGMREFWAPVAAYCASLAAGTLFSLWKLRGELRAAPRLSALAEVVPYAFIGALSLLSNAFIVSPGKLLLFKHHSAAHAGYFSAYFGSTVQVALTFVFLAGWMIVPLAARAKDSAQAWGWVRESALFLGLGGWAGFCVSSFLALLLLGRRYPLHLDWVVLFGAAGALVLLHGAASAVWSARGFQGLRRAAVGWILTGGANLGLSLWLTPRWGVAGAGVSLVAAYALGLAWYVSRVPSDAPETIAAEVSPSIGS